MKPQPPQLLQVQVQERPPICYDLYCGLGGWAKGSGKTVIVYIPALRESDLMVKMADYITADLDSVVHIVDGMRRKAVAQSSP